MDARESCAHIPTAQGEAGPLELTTIFEICIGTLQIAFLKSLPAKKNVAS